MPSQHALSPGVSVYLLKHTMPKLGTQTAGNKVLVAMSLVFLDVWAELSGCRAPFCAATATFCMSGAFCYGHILHFQLSARKESSDALRDPHMLALLRFGLIQRT